MPDTEKQPTFQYTDPNYEPVYKGGTKPTLVEKSAARPLTNEDVFDDYDRVLFDGQKQGSFVIVRPF